MTNLKLSSNFNENILHGVGNATLQNETITIEVEQGTTTTLLRGVNKVTLLPSQETKQTVSGKAISGDVYTLEKGEKRLIIKVETEDIKHETNLFINPEPIFDAISTKRKTTLTAGVLILVLLVVSVVFGIQQKNNKEFNTASFEKLTQAISNYEKSIAEGIVDKNEARSAFVEAKSIAEKLKNDGYKSEKLDKLLSDINAKESEILGEIKPEIKELLDLTLQINGFNGTKLASTGETMFAFDEKEKNIIKLDINGKDAKIVAGKDDLESVNSIASYEDRLFTLNTDGIYEIQLEGYEINETRIKTKDKDWNDPLFYLYSANIYLVDKGDNKIYRYAGNGKTFGDAGTAFADKTEWLAPGIEADFSKVIDMTIDGSIWLLSTSGKVTKFINGNPTSITMNGIISPLQNPTAIYTNEDLKSTYILDKDNGRVVVLEKNGDFKIQYSSDQIKNATDLIVSEKEGKIILLTGSKLMYFEPKQ